MVLARKNREEIGIFWLQEGKKLELLGKKIYPYSRGALNRSISVYQEFSLELLE